MDSGERYRLKRAYEPPASTDGVRVLVDRLWARGVSKVEAKLDAWMKQLGPSDELRQWFGHQPDRWIGFQERYRKELGMTGRQIYLRMLQSAAQDSTVTLVYGARDTNENEAVVIRDVLLARAIPAPSGDDDELWVLAAAGAVATARPDGAAPESLLSVFLGSWLSTAQLEATLRDLQERGE